jgi:hypothetical protein
MVPGFLLAVMADSMSIPGKKNIPARAVLVALVLAACMALWYRGLRTSPVMRAEMAQTSAGEVEMDQADDPASRLEHELARTYWQRYPDVREDPYYGINGPAGIHGARAHFQQHGKREGRVWGTVLLPPADQQD